MTHPSLETLLDQANQMIDQWSADQYSDDTEALPISEDLIQETAEEDSDDVMESIIEQVGLTLDTVKSNAEIDAVYQQLKNEYAEEDWLTDLPFQNLSDIKLDLLQNTNSGLDLHGELLQSQMEAAVPEPLEPIEIKPCDSVTEVAAEMDFSGIIAAKIERSRKQLRNEQPVSELAVQIEKTYIEKVPVEKAYVEEAYVGDTLITEQFVEEMPVQQDAVEESESIAPGAIIHPTIIHPTSAQSFGEQSLAEQSLVEQFSIEPSAADPMETPLQSFQQISFSLPDNPDSMFSRNSDFADPEMGQHNPRHESPPEAGADIELDLTAANPEQETVQPPPPSPVSEEMAPAIQLDLSCGKNAKIAAAEENAMFFRRLYETDKLKKKLNVYRILLSGLAILSLANSVLTFLLVNISFPASLFSVQILSLYGMASYLEVHEMSSILIYFGISLLTVIGFSVLLNRGKTYKGAIIGSMLFYGLDTLFLLGMMILGMTGSNPINGIDLRQIVPMMQMHFISHLIVLAIMGFWLHNRNKWDKI